MEVGPGDDILKRPELVRRHVVTNAAGEMHLALNPDGRCKALSGKLGCKVRCTIYHHRPRPCRRVEAGTPLCLWYRQQQGL